jgi:transcriptional regulator with XRE-family HTH domain
MRPHSPTAVVASEALGARVREARDGAKLSQRELAERVGVGRRTVQAWEAGTGGITWRNVEQVAAVTGASADWLAGQTDDVPAAAASDVSLDAIQRAVRDAVRDALASGLLVRLDRIEALLDGDSRQDDPSKVIAPPPREGEGR